MRSFLIISIIAIFLVSCSGPVATIQPTETFIPSTASPVPTETFAPTPEAALAVEVLPTQTEEITATAAPTQEVKNYPLCSIEQGNWWDNPIPFEDFVSGE